MALVSLFEMSADKEFLCIKDGSGYGVARELSVLVDCREPRHFLCIYNSLALFLRLCHQLKKKLWAVCVYVFCFSVCFPLCVL